MKKLSNHNILSFEAEKLYKELETERIRHVIACFGSEGVCAHCLHQDICSYSTTKEGVCFLRTECNGYDIAVSGTEIFVTKMKYSFEYNNP